MAYVNGLHGAAGKAAADAQAQADAAAAAAHAAMRAAKPKNQPGYVAPGTQAVQQPAPTDPVAGALGFDLPRKLAGIPTWMLMAGGLMAVMFVFGGKRR